MQTAKRSSTSHPIPGQRFQRAGKRIRKCIQTSFYPSLFALVGSDVDAGNQRSFVRDSGIAASARKTGRARNALGEPWAASVSRIFQAHRRNSEYCLAHAHTVEIKCPGSKTFLHLARWQNYTQISRSAGDDGCKQGKLIPAILVHQKRETWQSNDKLAGKVKAILRIELIVSNAE